MINITIEFNTKEALYLQIYKKIVSYIDLGILQAEEKLPSKRNLANHLGVSLNTIINAYNQLLDEGYIKTIEKKGYYVTKQEFVTTIKHVSYPTKEEKPFLYDLTTQTSEDNAFSYTSFIRCVKDALATKDYIKKSPLEGLEVLRIAISNHLEENRDIHVSPEQIIIGNGIEMLEKVFQLFKCHSLGIENPGYHKLATLLSSKGIDIEYLPIDEQGVILPKTSTALYTTSFNQFPTGIKMSISRKKELINWAQKVDGYIIEDDFDAEFRIGSVPRTSLYSLNPEKVIFFSSFSSTIFAGFRIAYIILPKNLSMLYKKTFQNHSNPVSSLDQMILYYYITKGDYARHINRLKNRYIKKRSIIYDFLKNSSIHIDNQKNFLSMLASIDPNIDITNYLQNLKNKKINLKTIGDYTYPPKPNHTLILGYTNITEESLTKVLQILIEELKK